MSLAKVGNRHKAKRSAAKKSYYTQYRRQYEFTKATRARKRTARLARIASGEHIGSLSAQKHRAKFARRKAKAKGAL